MKVRVKFKHDGEGQFPTFAKGTRVLIKEACVHYLHWYECEIDGYKTYVPDIYVCDGILTRDYNPTELVQDAGDMIEVREIVYAWLLGTNESGTTGWIPAEVVVSTDI